jgi:hypothetical protein
VPQTSRAKRLSKPYGATPHVWRCFHPKAGFETLAALQGLARVALKTLLYRKLAMPLCVVLT